MGFKDLPAHLHDRARFIQKYGRPPTDAFELDVARVLKLLPSPPATSTPKKGDH